MRAGTTAEGRVAGRGNLPVTVRACSGLACDLLLAIIVGTLADDKGAEAGQSLRQPASGFFAQLADVRQRLGAIHVCATAWPLGLIVESHANRRVVQEREKSRPTDTGEFLEL